MGNAIDFPNTYPLDGDLSGGLRYPAPGGGGGGRGGGGGGGGGGFPHMKAVGMLVVSLRGVIFGFWSHLGCSEQNAIIFSREGLV